MPAHRLPLPFENDTWPDGERWSSSSGPKLRWPAIAVSALVLLAAFTPSLLPRPWYMQAIVCAIGACLGYFLARFLQRAAHVVARVTGLRVVVPYRTRRVVDGVALVAVCVAGVAWWWSSHRTHQQTALAVSLDPAGLAEDVLATAAAVVATVLLVLILVGLRKLARVVARPIKRFVPTVVARGLAVLGIVAVILWATNDLLVRTTLEALAESAAADDVQEPVDLTAPTSPLRSGSPGAAQSWQALGHNGMKFTASGPDAARIEATVGGQAMEPVRVYASPDGPGRDATLENVNGAGIDRAVEIVISEMYRTGAFDRSYLHLVTTTGAGWVEEFDVESVEYLTRGDVATAAIQYSHLPSVAALVVDRTSPVQAGTRLTERVEQELAKMPADQRPKLLVSGLSLGSFGGQGAFADAEDMLSRVDGAVWIGTPRFTQLWSALTENRRGGSPEVAPVIGDAAHIRFATRPEELTADYYGRSFGEWKGPRVAYLQYASDAMVWWDWSLIWSKPDWLIENAGHDVSEELRWAPLVTFAQVSADTAAADKVPPGHGHIYHADVVPTWAAVISGIADVPGPETYPNITEAIKANIPQSSQPAQWE